MVYSHDEGSQALAPEYANSLRSELAENIPATARNELQANPINGDANRFSIEAHELYAELVFDNALSPSQIELSDSRYNLPDHSWVTQKFLPYISNYFKDLGISVVGEGMDCDNISHFFRQQLSLCNFQGRQAHNGDIACGIVKTKQIYGFGGVKGDGNYHSLVLLRTNLGWYAIEPQTGEIAPISNYPNASEINWVLL